MKPAGCWPRMKAPSWTWGGGAAPYYRATHVLDILPFSAPRLEENAWGKGGERDEGGVRGEARKAGRWIAERYTQMDLCGGREWPFADKQFDLAVSSHCLEDLRDPLPAVRQMSRVARRTLVIVPSRLLEQTLGIDHPRYCGFYHHPWIVYAEGEKLVFRRKTPTLMLPKCHIVCPAGKRIRTEWGSSFFAGDGFEPEERAFWSENEEYEDYRRFIDPFRKRRDLWARDERVNSWGYRLWKLRQRWLGGI